MSASRRGDCVAAVRRWRSRRILVSTATCAPCSRRSSEFSSGELADLSRGQVVKRGLPSRAPGEIAVAGAVRIRAQKSAFFARVRDIVRFKSGEGVLQIGRFSTPPVLEDLAALTIDKDDFDPRSCRVGDCGVRLPAAMIERVRPGD